MKPKMKLIINEKEIPVVTKKVITGRLITELRELIAKKPVDKFQKIIYEELMESGEEINDLELTKRALKSGKVTADEIARFRSGDAVPEDAEADMEFYFKFFHRITDLEKTGIPEEYDKEFYLDQDFLVIKTEVNSFRKTYSI